MIGSILVYPPGWMTAALLVLLIFLGSFLIGTFVPFRSVYSWGLSLVGFASAVAFFTLAPLPTGTDYSIIYGGLSIYYLVWVITKLGELKNDF